MKFKIKYADQIVGALSILAIASLIVFAFFIGSKQKWFETKHPFHTYVASGNSVSEGMAIQFKGFGIGKIKKIRLDDQDRVVVDFYISDEYIHKVTEGSVIEVSVSPIGLGSSVVLHPGNSSTIMEDDSVIPEKSSPEGKQLIAQNKVTIAESTDSITTILSSVMSLVADIDKLVQNINSMVEGDESIPLANTVYDINILLEQINMFLAGDESVPLSAITTRINGILADINSLTKDLNNVQGLVPKLLESEENKGSIDQLFTTINSTITGLNGITNSLDGEMPQVSILLTEIETLLKQVDDVLIGLSNNPLLKNGIPQRKEKESAAPKYREDKF